MTRQYVGARYVPKFASPMEWDNSRPYEALEIVTYMGSSYTSKIPVPVGAEISDQMYWVCTGNYNAQVELYREEVEELREEVEALGTIANMTERLKNKNILIIGGSNSVYNSSSDSTRDKWADKFRDRMETLGSTVTNLSQGGKCLTSYNGSTGGDCVSSIINSATAETLASYDIIIINAGVNDFREGISIGNVNDAAAAVSGTFNAGLTSISANIHNKCPASLVYIITPLSNWEMYEEVENRHWGKYPVGFKPYRPLFVYAKAMQSWAARNGFTVIDGSAAPMLLATNANMRTTWQHDGLHVNPYTTPYTPSYADILCDYIYFHILSGISDVFHHADVRFDLKQLNADMSEVSSSDAFINSDFLVDKNTDPKITTVVAGTFSADGSFTLHCLLRGEIEADTNYTVMTLPDSMTPYTAVYTQGTVTVTDKSWCSINIDADGDVHVTPAVTASVAIISFDVTYKLGCCDRQIRDLQPIYYDGVIS